MSLTLAVNPPERADAQPTLGRRLCDAEGLDYSETLHRQFVLAQDRVDVPEGWLTHCLGTWFLHHCPSLNCCTLRTASGAPAALVLGVAIDPEGSVLGQDAMLVPEQGTECFVEALAGRYVAFVSDDLGERVYVDPSCSLTAVYDEGTRRVGSSLPLVLDRTIEPLAALPPETYRATQKTYYLFGDTVDARARRLTPNHTLDLSDFTLRRHWPGPADDFGAPDDECAVLDSLLAKLSANMAALVTAFPCSLPITGGGDSRILLAATAERLDQVAHFHCHVRNWASSVDSIVAVAVAERLNVPLQLISAATPRVSGAISDARLGDLVKMADLRSGFQTRMDKTTVLVHEMAPKGAEVVLRGGLVEMTRSNKWKPRWGDLTPEKGVRALAHPMGMDEALVAASVPRYADWMDGLPEHARSRAIDLAHLELWMPTTMHPAYQALTSHFLLNPFNDRRLLQATARLPYAYRRSGRPQRHIIETYLPEVADCPYAGRKFGMKLRKAAEGESILRIMGRR